MAGILLLLLQLLCVAIAGAVAALLLFVAGVLLLSEAMFADVAVNMSVWECLYDHSQLLC